MGNKSEIKNYVYDIIKNECDRPIPERVLKYKLIQNHKNELGFIRDDDFFATINDLIKEKKIKKTMSGSLVDITSSENKKEFNRSTEHKSNKFTNLNLDMNAPILKGVIHINSGGNGFISLTDKDSAQWFVNKEQINNAQNCDTVTFSEINVPSRGNLKDAFVREIIQHAKDMYVGEFISNENDKKVVLDDNKSTLNIVLDDYSGLVNGSKILIKIEKYEGNTAYGSLLKIIGHKSDVGVDILSIVYDNGVEPEFNDDAMTQAKKITLNITDEDRKIRTDLSDKPIITIDPATSKDFDDAFYCEKRADGKFLLAVQIADVSHYVTYQSPLDKSSIERGCSVYLIDRVIPMVPHNLSDDVCSLNPGVERMALACDMIINNKGDFEDIKVYPAIIKSHRRFSYDNINDYFDKKDDFSKEETAVKNSVDAGKELSDILTKMKNDRGYINFEIPKAVIKVNEKGEPIEIVKEIHGRAQKMIEDFMVAANEAVTINANKKGYPFIYRVHDKPDEQRLQIFAIEAKKMNFKITTSLDDVQSDTISK
jgi:ribonuclease R